LIEGVLLVFTHGEEVLDVRSQKELLTHMDGVGYRQNDIVPSSGEADGGVGEGVVMDTIVNDILSELYEDADDFSAKGCTDFFANEELFCAFYDLGQKLHIQGTLIAK
jgi:hypothetical protein